MVQDIRNQRDTYDCLSPQRRWTIRTNESGNRNIPPTFHKSSTRRLDGLAFISRILYCQSRIFFHRRIAFLRDTRTTSVDRESLNNTTIYERSCRRLCEEDESNTRTDDQVDGSRQCDHAGLVQQN